MGAIATAFLGQTILPTATEPPERDSTQDILRTGGNQLGVHRLDDLIRNKAVVQLELPVAASISTSTTSNGLGVPAPYKLKVWAFFAGCITGGDTCTANLMHTPSGGSAATMLTAALDIKTDAGTKLAQGTISESADDWGVVEQGELLHCRVINGSTTSATGTKAYAWVQRL
jgi:hypothetical protein